MDNIAIGLKGILQGIDLTTSWKVSPSKLKGTLVVPPSKSQTMRALLFGLLASGKSIISNPLPFPEMIQTCRLLGATVNEFSDRVEIFGLNGRLDGAEDVIQAGNSGLILRFVGAIAALSAKPIVITGDHSIRHRRPIQPLLDGLNQLGATAFSLSQRNTAPILIKGPLYPGQAILEGEDSQPVSGLLIASCFSQGPTKLFITNPGEIPWVSLTLGWFDFLNIRYEAKGSGDYYSVAGNVEFGGFSYQVPSDLSTLAFPLVAAILTDSELLFENLDFTDLQGDKRILSILQEMGANLEVRERSLHVKKGGMLRGIAIDVNDCIDTLPILSVAGCFAEGEMKIMGAKNARKKECDRISTLALELSKMGGKVQELEDGLLIQRSDLTGAIVNSHHDHRIALALAVAGFAATSGETLIEGVSCVAKTFPAFKTEMQSLGASID